MSSAQPTAAAATVFPNYGATVTSVLVGSLLNFFLFGTLLIQVYVYRICFPKDSLGVKLYVYFIFLVMTACTCLNGADVEYWFGSGFGNVAHFADGRNSYFYTPLMGSFIGMLVQLFFCYRVVAIRRAAWPLALLTSLISMAQCAGGMGTGIIGYIDGLVPDRTRTILVYLWLISNATGNIFTAGAMTYLLLAVEAVPTKGDIVKKAVRMVIETNVLTAITAFVALVLFFVCPNTTYWVCPAMILPGIYANTLLVTLNNRAIQRMGPDFIETSTATSIAFRSSRFSGATTNSRAPLARSATVYSANGLGRVLSVPAMSFARREPEDSHSEMDVQVQEKRPRNSTERQWRNGEEDVDSESEYASDDEVERQV